MTVAQPACMTCKHYHRDDPVTCDAFPLRIPDLIWLEGDPHTGPVAGDHGIQFEKGVPKGADARK
jgi:hypothetical protein